MSARIVSVGVGGSALLAALHQQGLAPGWSEAEFAKIMGTPGAFALVVQADRPCGMLAGWVVADEAEILALAVIPEARRHGFATDLVSAAAAEAGRRGARSLFLEVRAGNEAARALYHAAGFQQAGRRRGYYSGPNEDALILRRDLTPAPLDLRSQRS
jgi:[ribosomal protein S18]-alanine N-acetyltransferase